MYHKWTFHFEVRFLMIFIGLLFLIFCLPRSAFALKINEVYAAPAIGETEWVEIYNDSDISIDLSLFALNDIAGNKILLPSQFLAPFEFISATASAVINNSGDTLFLKQADITLQSLSTPPMTSGQSYAACPDGSAEFGLTKILTKNISNLSACTTPTLSPSPSITPSPLPTIVIANTNSEVEVTATPPPTLTYTPTPSPTPTVTAPVLNLMADFDHEKIFINEFSPFSTDEVKEWVEIYNDNDIEADLFGWSLDDIEGGSAPIDLDITIPAKGLLVIELKNSIWNNAADTIRLLDEDDVVRDSFDYKNAKMDISIGRSTMKKSTQFCEMKPTKALVNSSCLTENPTTSPSPTSKANNPSSTPLPTLIADMTDYRVIGASARSTAITKEDTLLRSSAISTKDDGSKTKSLTPPPPIFFFVTSLISLLASTSDIIKKYLPHDFKFW